jgi:hypothetical protein
MTDDLKFQKDLVALLEAHIERGMSVQETLDELIAASIYLISSVNGISWAESMKMIMGSLEITLREQDEDTALH